MRSNSRRLVGRLVLLTLFAMLAVPGAVAAQEATDEAPALKVAVGGCLAGGADCLETATLIEPNATVVDATPHPWESVSVSGDGTTLSVYFWMGVPECNGLHSVEVTSTDSGIDLVLNTGIPAGAEDLMCIALAQLYRTDVELDQPLIGGAFPG